MSNQIKCENCVNFDPQHKFVNGKKRLVWYGFCAAQSKYPTKEQDGQIFPADADRVAEGEVAQMVTVKRDGIVKDCLLAIKKGSK